MIRLNRFAEAKEVFEKGPQELRANSGYFGTLYILAFIAGDTVAMQQQLALISGRPDGEEVSFFLQATAPAFAGQWQQAQDFARRAIELAKRNDVKEIAVRYMLGQALYAAVFGQFTSAKVAAAKALALAPQRNRETLASASLALALSGESSQAQSLADELVKRYPTWTVVNGIMLPPIKATLELQRGNAQAAIDQLQPALRYEAAADFWPQYVRGLAYLELKQSAEAATEFQKIIDHRGEAPLSVLWLLAHLGLARAAALTGDTAKARKAYEDFFTLWKDADADLPILVAAKQEYAKLK